MEFKANMLTKDGKKMMYLIYLGVNKDCEDYEAVWSDLKRKMSIISEPIIPVNWDLFDDNGKVCTKEDGLFYAKTFETGMGFVSGILKIHEIRSNLEFCNFYNGDAYRTNPKRYDAEDSLRITKQLVKKYRPDEIW
ncbi:MAG: hypothetical protein J6N15_12165 [Ruminiclostridium sp.]|nr:hypothetical protein [Ruminiclostridium sp.]